MKKTFKHLTLAILCAVIIAGCSSPYLKETGISKSLSIDFGEDSWIFKPLDYTFYSRLDRRSRALAKEDFSIVVGNVVDRRKPLSYTYDVEKHKLIHEYNPDKFLQNAPMFIQNSLQKHLAFGPPKDKVYVADVTLRHMRMRITKGNFMSGRWGEYVVDVEMDVLVRDNDGLILDKTPVTITHTETRHGFQGRQTSAKVDRSKMVSALDEAFHPLAVEIAWHARRGDARRRGGSLTDWLF